MVFLPLSLSIGPALWEYGATEAECKAGNRARAESDSGYKIDVGLRGSERGEERGEKRFESRDTVESVKVVKGWRNSRKRCKAEGARFQRYGGAMERTKKIKRRKVLQK